MGKENGQSAAPAEARSGRLFISCLLFAVPGWLFGLLTILLSAMPRQQAQGFGMLLGILGLPLTIAAGVISLVLALDKWLRYLAITRRGGNGGKNPVLFLAVVNIPYLVLGLYFLAGIQAAMPKNLPADNALYGGQEGAKIWKAAGAAIFRY